MSVVITAKHTARPRLVDVKAAAEQLGVTPRTVRKLLHTGELPHHKVRQATRINVEDLDAFIARNRRESTR